ncbi:rhodanese-related sulfurtransferase, partial [Burkholderia contaminans]
RGARIVLADDDGVRADMTASWLAQMGWDVRVVEPEDGTARFDEPGQPPRDVPAPPSVTDISPATLAGWLKEAVPGELAIVDVT